jgi:hypothetical protein
MSGGGRKGKGKGKGKMQDIRCKKQLLMTEWE